MFAEELLQRWKLLLLFRSVFVFCFVFTLIYGLTFLVLAL